MNRFYLGVLLVFMSAVCFGLIPVFAKYAYAGGANVTTLLLLRFTIATLIFCLYIFIKFKKVELSRSNLLSLFLLGGVLYTLQANCYFASVKYIPASLAVLLFYAYPIFVVLLSLLVEKEMLTRQILSAMALSIIGLTMVLGTSFGQINILGILLSIAAALVYSCYIVYGNRVVKQLPSVVTSAFVSFFAACSLLAIGLSSGSLAFNLTAQAWTAVVGIAVFCTVIAIFTFFKGMELIGSTRASILSMIEPLVTIGFSALVFYERMTWFQLLGGAAVLLGAVLVVSSREKSTGKEAVKHSNNISGTT